MTGDYPPGVTGTEDHIAGRPAGGCDECGSTLWAPHDHDDDCPNHPKNE